MECSSGRELEQRSSRVSEQRSAGAARHWSSGVPGQQSAGVAWRRNGAGLEQRRYSVSQIVYSTRVDHVPRIVFWRSFTQHSRNVRHRSHAVGRVRADLSAGSPQGALLSSDPFLSKRPPRMGVFQGLRATFEKRK